MTLLDEDLDVFTFTDDAGDHVLCCHDRSRWEVDQVAPARFLCGVGFHPEMLADLTDRDRDACPDCIQIVLAAVCPPHQPSHMHCPYTDQRCP